MRPLKRLLQNNKNCNLDDQGKDQIYRDNLLPALEANSFLLKFFLKRKKNEEEEEDKKMKTKV